MSDVSLTEALAALVDSRRHEWPARAFEQVVEGLRSSCRHTRSLALRLAARDVYDAVACELIALLEGRAADDVERMATLDAIAGVVERGAAFDFDIPCNPSAATRARFEQLLQTLRAIFHDPDEALSLRLRALDVAARASAPWAEGAARAAWATDSAPWRRAAVRALGWFAVGDAYLPEAVGDDDPVVRILAWQAAARRGFVGLGEASLDCALDRDCPPEERAAALTAVGRLAPQGGERALREAADNFEAVGLGGALSDTLAELALADDGWD